MATAIWVPDGNKMRDITGGGRDGTTNGAVRVERDPFLGHVFASYAVAGDNVDFGALGADTDSITLMMMVKSAPSNSGTFMVRGATTAYSVWMNQAAELGRFNIVNSAAVTFNLSGGVIIPYNWHHLAMTVDWAGLTLKGYVDGAPVASMAITGTAFRTSVVGWQAFRNTVDTNAQNCWIAYASLRNVLMTAQQIQGEADWARRALLSMP